MCKFLYDDFVSDSVDAVSSLKNLMLVSNTIIIIIDALSLN